MIQLSTNKLIIEIEHSLPEEYAHDLKIALISAIQSMDVSEYTDPKESHETIFTLLELLKGIS